MIIETYGMNKYLMTLAMLSVPDPATSIPLILRIRSPSFSPAQSAEPPSDNKQQVYIRIYLQM